MAIEKKELGKTGVMVPEIGQGTWRYRGGVKPLQKGIELGATLIDTAEMYRTEDVVGQALRDQREGVFLASKVLPSHLHYDDVLKAADASLRLLKVDHMDLYQVHWPNSSVPIKETMAAMATLVDRGLVKFIGVSNFSTRQLQEAQGALSNLPIVSNQVLYNLKNRRIERDLLPYCQKNGVTIIAYTPLADGSLATGPKIGRDKRIQALQSVADQAAKTMAQVALNWCTSHEDVIAIPKTNSVSRTMENCGASGWRLTPEQIDVLDQAFAAG